jgi:hypothetical protein
VSHGGSPGGSSRGSPGRSPGGYLGFPVIPRGVRAAAPPQATRSDLATRQLGDATARLGNLAIPGESSLEWVSRGVRIVGILMYSGNILAVDSLGYLGGVSCGYPQGTLDCIDRSACVSANCRRSSSSRESAAANTAEASLLLSLASNKLRTLKSIRYVRTTSNRLDSRLALLRTIFTQGPKLDPGRKIALSEFKQACEELAKDFSKWGFAGLSWGCLGAVCGILWG